MSQKLGERQESQNTFHLSKPQNIWGVGNWDSENILGLLCRLWSIHLKTTVSQN
jgi:hypothetical protein